MKTALLAATAAMALVSRSAIPEDAVRRVSESLPAAFSPMPAGGANKIFPLVSEKSSTLDRKYAITIGEKPFAVTAISEDGRAVEMSVPAGLHTTEFARRWFKADDIFGKIKWSPEDFTPDAPMLAYFPAGKGVLELSGKIAQGTPCVRLSSVPAGRGAKGKLDLLQYSAQTEAGGMSVQSSIVLAKPNPPVKTQAEYDARAKQLMSEHAFRTGRPWGKMFPSLLGNGGAYECAAMTADFATYMFDGSLHSGERFEKADEIRAGDTIRMKGHFFAVVYRKGAQLTTIEGNMNESVHQSKGRYSVKDGKLFCGGKDAGFEYGHHNWPPAK